MNRYKKILFQVGILLFVLAICIFVLEQRKQFISIDFSKHYSNNKTIELSGFEESEKWQGNYSYDSERVLEGKTSITLSSWYGKENSIQSDQVTILPPGYVDGYLSVYVPGKQNLSSLVSFTLNLIGEKDQKMEYTFTSLMHVGWNRIPVAIPNWKKITSRSFSIKSKPQAIAEINLDRFWIENTTIYGSDIFSTHNQSLSLRTIGDRTYLFSTSPELESYTLTTPSFLRRGSVIISLIPEHAKEIRLSLNTTSLKLTGKHMNECILYKNNNAPTTKVLQTASGKDDLYVFIKAEVQGNKVAYSLSNNGVDFESCGSVVSSYKNRIQLFLQGSYLIDSYSAEY
ncbi:MAG: hypothetical protein V1922_03825 [bacterium]